VFVAPAQADVARHELHRSKTVVAPAQAGTQGFAGENIYVTSSFTNDPCCPPVIYSVFVVSDEPDRTSQPAIVIGLERSTI